MNCLLTFSTTMDSVISETLRELVLQPAEDELRDQTSTSTATPRWAKPSEKRLSGMCSAIVASGSGVAPTQKKRWLSSTASATGFSR